MTYKPFEKDQKSAFDEVLIVEPTPTVQLDFPYNINTDIIEKRENNSGTITQATGMAVIQSGGSTNSAAHMLSRVALKYDPGQGGLVRFTALFTTGVANSVQLAGLGEVGDGFFFGYNGAAFSILRREKGKPEIQTLTVSSASGSGAGTITINLDGVAKTLELELNDTVREIAVKIADTDFDDTGLGWTATVNNATVIFKAWSDGNKTGTFSLADTDTTGAEGTFAETVAGASTTNNWIAQASWNVDVMDGTGPSGMTLDPTKGNVYQIGYQWLGFGMITYFIENSDTGDFQPVHRIKYANTNTEPSLQNPTLPLHVMAKNTSNTSNLTVKTSSMAAFVEGRVRDLGIINARSDDLTSLATTELPVLSIKNKVVYQSTINRVQVEPLFISLASEGSKPIIFRIKLNPTLTGTPAFADVSTNTSVVSVDTSASGITASTGRELLTLVLGKTDSKLLDFTRIKRMLHPGDSLTVTAEATAGTGQEATVSFTWEELF